METASRGWSARTATASTGTTEPGGFVESGVSTVNNALLIFWGNGFLAIFAGADAANGGERRVQGVFSLWYNVGVYSGCRNTRHTLQKSCGCDFVLYDDSP
jgi:hypothetical protein